jgi:histidinol-phosphate aminotransferase
LHPLARSALTGLDLPDPERRERLFRVGVVDLISNLNPYRGELARYPPARPLELQARYAAFLCDGLRASGLVSTEEPAVTGEQVLFTCGSVEGISLLVAAFCEPKADCVCVCDPTFPFYARAACCNDVDVRHVPLKGEDLDRFDVHSVVAGHPKLTFLCSPSNPVGTTLDSNCVAELLACNPGLVVIDEAYVEFSTRPSALRWLFRAPNLVVLRTFSKAWGLAGIRLGAVIANPPILHTLRLVQLSYAFGLPAQRLAQERLQEQSFIERDVQRIRTERDRLARALRALEIVKRVYPSDTNFLLVAFEDVFAARQALVDAGILIADCGQQVPNTLRISVGTAEDCLRVIDVLSGKLARPGLYSDRTPLDEAETR